MEPREYLPAYLEREYLTSHEGLTPAARELVHEEILRSPAKYAATEHAQALAAYAQAHENLMRELERMEDLPDEEFDNPLGTYTGAGVIFGATGGVMEAALRTAVDTLTGESLPRDA